MTSPAETASQTSIAPMAPGRSTDGRQPCKTWDLFCGGSGAGTGVLRGLRRLGYAPKCTGVNHNKHAVATSRKNHPEHTFLCSGVDEVAPIKLYPQRDVLLGWGSPQCIFHSVARGGCPINDQERSTAYCVWRWVHQTKPVHILVENVPEFEWWGRLMQKRKHGKLVWMRRVMRNGKWVQKEGKWRTKETTEVPIQQWSRTEEQYRRDLSRWGYEPCMIKDPAFKGEEFRRWVARGRALGYLVDWRVLNAADYGDPTSRRRIFIQAVRADSGLKIVWPSPTHAKPDQHGRVPNGLEPWHTAREILDLNDYGKSIFDRPRPLSPKTLRRILIGLLKYGLGPFSTPKQGCQSLAPKGRRNGMIQPSAFLLPGFGERDGQEPRTRSFDETMPAVTAQGHLHPVKPLLICMEHQGKVCGADEAPLPTITTAKGGAMAVAQPFIVPKLGLYQNNGCRSVDEPLPTVITDGRINMATSFIIPQQSNPTPKGIDEPVPTVVAEGSGHKLATSFLLPQQRGGKQVKGVDEPVSPITRTGAEAMVTSEFLVQVAHGNDKGKSNEDNRRARPTNTPLPPITGSHEFGLASALVKLKGTGTANSPDEPLAAIGASGQHHALMSSVVKYYGTGTAKPTTVPLDALTAKARLALVQPEISNHCIVQTAHEGADESRVKSADEALPAVAGNRGDVAVISFQIPSLDGQDTRQAILHLNGLRPGGKGRPVLEVGVDHYEIEIYFRMLKVAELARAQSFPEGYQFCGSKTDAIKQIGNAVPGQLAEALTIAAVSQCEDIRPFLLLDAA
ncbi:MAG: DNA cytosine methyltransferase [Opitutaceae bacterium]|nr:DNA cytosine methyltransferase [Opitutaceae bacterium]